LLGLLGPLHAATAGAEARPCGPPEPLASAVLSIDKSLPEPATPASVRWLAGPGFGFGLAAWGAAALACAPPNLARAALKEVVLGAERALGVDPQIAIVLTTHALDCGNIYYVPLANDVLGIGYRHGDPREVFDDTPGQRLEGVAFLNDWPYWQARPDELESALNHEVGHRWGARVHARIAGVASDGLLGRAQDHWSYFLDSGGSPLEGNVWRATEPRRSSETPRHPTQFSPLDRYLMGVLPAAEVPPFELLVDPVSDAKDCRGHALGPASPPQTCGTLEIAAEPVSVSIDDVIAVEGPRLPAAGAAPRQVGVLVLMLQSRDETWSASECEVMARSMREGISAFEGASAGGVQLDNVLSNTLSGVPSTTLGGALSCDDIGRTASDALPSHTDTPSAAAARSSCSVSSRSRQGSRGCGSRGCLGACLVALLLWRRLRRRAPLRLRPNSDIPAEQ
jgi:hypothetical protein